MDAKRYMQLKARAMRMVSTMAENGFGTFLITRDKDHLPWSTEYDKIHSLGINTSAGETKFVFWDDECDYVFKIPFAGCNEDYCETELEIYNTAEECGLARCFAWCFQIADIDLGEHSLREWIDYTDEEADQHQNETDFRRYGYYRMVPTRCHLPIYIMDFADVDPDGITSASESIQRASKAQEAEDRGEDPEEDCESEMSDIVSGDSTEGVAFVLMNEWGADVYDQFLDFQSKYHVNDLHAANVGYVGDRLVLIDYSGYRG